MRVAIIADIHGNDLAFAAVAAEIAAGAIDRVICLGDAIQGGPQPAAVVARLRANGWPVVMGNADAFLLTGSDTGDEPIDAARRRVLDETRDWTLAQLSEDDRTFIAAFPLTLTMPLPGERQLRAFHASPVSFDDILLPTSPEEEFVRLLAPEARAIYTGGHTHVQFIRHLGRTFFFNPGSVGNAWRHGQLAGQFRADPWAEYAILTVEDDGHLALEFRRVPFDTAEYRRIVATSGIPFARTFAARYDEDVVDESPAQ